MQTVLTISEAANNLESIVSRVTALGETVILTQNGTAIARIVPPLVHSTGFDLALALESAPRLEPEEANAFADDIETARAKMNGSVLP